VIPGLKWFSNEEIFEKVNIMLKNGSKYAF
jgi:hypothetical protein